MSGSPKGFCLDAEICPANSAAGKFTGARIFIVQSAASEKAICRRARRSADLLDAVCCTYPDCFDKRFGGVESRNANRFDFERDFFVARVGCAAVYFRR